MDRLLRARHALPLSVLVLVPTVDLLLGRGQTVLTLLVLCPVVAASVLGRRPTAGYAAMALVGAALLGAQNGLYSDGAAAAQFIRLAGVSLGGVLAVVLSTVRLRREAQLRRATAEAARARGAVQLAETLQHSLLTDPPAVPGLQIAARYLPAVQHAQVGGDWYDAFPLPDGSTMLVIGDVAGHDVAAAATMGQARGLLRGIASTVVGSPAEVLAAMDRALHQLQVDTLVTVVAATVRRDPAHGTLLTWANAGHPAPVLLAADGTVRVLDRPAQLLLGVAPEVVRVDHELPLGVGDTVLLYTDGLIERRGVALDDGTDWLVEALTAIAGRSLEDLCDGLLADMAGQQEDDVALLGVRVARCDPDARVSAATAG